MASAEKGGGAGKEGVGKDGAAPRLQPVHAFGVNGPIRNNCAFVSPTVVVHPAGQHVALYDMEARDMQFLQKGRAARAVLAMDVAPKRNYIAVCEACTAEGTAQVSVFHAGTRNRMRTMTLASTEQFVACAFTADGKQLLTQTEGPEAFQLTLWRWEQEKQAANANVGCPVSRVRAANAASGAGGLITTSGPMHLRAWTASNDGSMKNATLVPFVKEQENWVDHVWMADGCMVACADNGLCIVFGYDEASSSLVAKTELTCRTHLPGTRIQTIASHSKGFLVGGSFGFVEAWEASDDQREPYAWLKSFSVDENETIHTIAVSPNDDAAVMYTKSGRLLSFALGSIDMPEQVDVFADVVANGVHTGSILSMDTCLQKPLVFTVSSDKTARVWNFFRWRCELSQSLSEMPTCIGVHPNGFQVVIGFRERLRLYNVLLDSLRPFKDMPAKNCRELRFSHGGHVFASACGISVHVYATHTMELLHTFNGHIAPVSRLIWSRDDRHLYSAGADGGVYGWHLASGARLEDSQHVVKQCQYAALVVDSPDKGGDPCGPFAACGTDFKLRVLNRGEQTMQIDTGGAYLTALVLSHSNKMLFAGTSQGAVRLYPWPLTQECEFSEFQLHSGPVSRLRLTPDDAYLFSSSEDGSLFALQVSPEGATHVAPPDSRQFNVDAVLVSQEEMEDQSATLADLRSKLEQLKSDTDYSLHRQEAEWSDKMKFAKQDADESMAAERSRYEELQARHEQYVRDHVEELEKKGREHVHVTQELENQYEHKLATELTRYDQLSEEMEALRQRCEGLLEAQDSRHQRLAAEEKQKAEKQQLAQAEKIRQMHEDLKYNEVKFEEVLAQQETEYESELQKMKQSMETALGEERKNTARQQGGLSGMRNKYEGLKKKKKEAEEKLLATENLYRKEVARSKKLAETLRHYEQHLEQREESLDEKERTILSLRSTNRTLDNFRFVLDHRLQQLKEEKGPLTKHIEGLEAHVHRMYDELVVEHQGKKQMASVIEHKDAKMQTQQRELQTLRAIVRERDRNFAAFTRQLSTVVTITIHKELEDAVKDLYREFVKGEKASGRPTKARGSSAPSAPGGAATGGRGAADDEGYSDDEDEHDDGEGGGGGGSEAAREVRRQRDYMQKTVATLKKALKQIKTEAASRARTSMAENSLLISECNHLRKEGRKLRMQLDQAAQQIHIERQKQKRQALEHRKAAGRASAAASVSELDAGGGEAQRSARQSGPNLGGGASSMPALPTPAGGQLIRGSTRALVEVSSTRSKVGGMLSQLDDNNREIELQRIEIRRLREQVFLLMNQLQRGGGGEADGLQAAQVSSFAQPDPLSESAPVGGV
eukprot:g1084.t1